MLSAGKMDVESAPFSPSSLVNETIQLFQASAHLMKGLKMKSYIKEKSLPNVVLGYRCKIQILMNLLNNGMNFGRTVMFITVVVEAYLVLTQL